MFKKICKNPNCGKEFYSETRNQAYCCPECRVRHIKRKKTKKKAYSEDIEFSRLLARTHAISVSLMSYYKPREEWICKICGSGGEEVHHINEDPFDNRKENLQILCVKCHARIHAKE